MREENKVSWTARLNERAAVLARLMTPQRWAAGLAVVVLAAVLAHSWQSPSGRGGGLPGSAAQLALSSLVISPAQAAEGFQLTPERPDSLGVPADGAFLLKSQMPVKKEMIEQYLTSEPSVPLVVKEVGAQEWRITPAQPLPAGKVLKLSLDTTVTDADGSSEQREFRWAFQVKSEFKALGTLPRQHATNVPVNTGIEVTFSHESFGDVAAHFRIEPAVAGEFRRYRRIMAFVPKEPLAKGTVYSVVIDKGLPLNGSEERLAEDIAFTFETEGVSGDRSANWFSLDEDASFLSGDDQVMQLDVWSYNDSLRSLDAKVYRVEDATAYARLQAERDRWPRWTMKRDEARLSTAGLPLVASANLPIKKMAGLYSEMPTVTLPQRLTDGWYLLELSSPKLTRQVLVQVSPLAAFVEVTSGQSVVWVQDTRSGRPAGRASVSLGGKSLGRTADDGLLTFTMPDRTEQETTAPQLTVTADNATVVVRAGTGGEAAYRSSDSDGSGWGYLYTDRPRYQRSDTINFWGLARDRDGKPVQKLKAELYREGYFGYFGETVNVAEADVTANERGIYQGSLKLEGVKADYYTLVIRDADGRMARSSYIYVAPYTKPTYQLELTADRRTVFSGEPITLTAKAKFFEGTPVPKMPLKLSLSDGYGSPETQNLTTDDSGVATWTVKRDVKECPRGSWTGAACGWPLYLTATVEPAGNEAGDVVADLGLSVFGPRQYVSSTVTRTKGETTYHLKSRQIDLAAIETAPAWTEDWMGREPAPGLAIEALVTETRYLRKQTGTRYDFVNKVSVPEYVYDEKKTVRPAVTVTTDAGGLTDFTLRTEPNVSYEVTFRWAGPNGLIGELSSWDAYYDGYSLWEARDSDFLQLSLNGKDGAFGVGETVVATFKRGNTELPSAAGRFLYLKHREGLRNAEVGGAARHEFRFGDADVPNISLLGVYWNGRQFERAQAYASFRSSDRELDISLETDKASYRPGEEVRLSARVTDKQGQPVAADLNVNLVDEAFYAVTNDVASPRSSVYAAVGDGVVYTGISNPPTLRDQSAAEFGGCFLGGTKVRLADGSEQPIETVKVGQQVRTFADPTTREYATGTVLSTYRHVVREVITVNGRLTATPEHRVFANYSFKTVGELKLGDVMLDAEGRTVPVVSLQRQVGEFRVYNLEIGPQHTFFADGFYVHNEKGGGPREFFVDTAVFQQMTTGRDGRGSLKFKLPDNLTSWRVTVQGISPALGVGVEVTKLPVLLPAFVDMTLSKTYLTADEPVVRLRAFGTALKPSDLVKFSLTAGSLGLTTPLTVEGAPFQPVNLSLPKLAVGRHALVATMQSSAGDDSLKLSTEVVSSRLTKQDVAYAAEAKAGQGLPRLRGDDGRLVISDEGKDELFAPLSDLAWTWGNRIDQALVRRAATMRLNKAFNEEYDVPAFDSTPFTTFDGSMSLLTYSSGDAALTARLAALFPNYFDTKALASYFSTQLTEQRTLSTDQVSDALLGAAACGAPVLTALDAWAQSEKLDAMGTLKLAAAYQAAGSGEKALPLVRRIISEQAKVSGDGLVINVGKEADDRAEATVLAAWLAVKLGLPDHAKLWRGFVSLQKETNEPFYLERAAYVLAALDRRAARPASITYVLDGQERRADLSGGELWSFAFDAANQSFEVKAVTGQVRLTLLQRRPAKDAELRTSDQLQVKREYYVDGKRVTSLRASDLVEVRLTPRIGDVEGNGNFRLTDYLPSGLVPVSRIYTDNSAGCYGWITSMDEESLTFYVWKDMFNYCPDKYVHYFARVKTAGTYVAEPAVLQSYVHPELINASSEVTLEIKP